MAKERLTSVFAGWVAAVVLLGERAVAAAVEGLKAAIKPPESKRKVAGKVIESREVDLVPLQTDLELRDVRRDTRELVTAFERECARRGELWTRECAHQAVTDYLVKPLEAALAKLEGAPVDGTAGKIAELSARVAALETALAPKPRQTPAPAAPAEIKVAG